MQQLISQCTSMCMYVLVGTYGALHEQGGGGSGNFFMNADVRSVTLTTSCAQACPCVPEGCGRHLLQERCWHTEICTAIKLQPKGRAYPDLAAMMDGVPLCFNGRCNPSIVGGTSASTPTVAGIFSLVNDHRLNAGLGE